MLFEAPPSSAVIVIFADPVVDATGVNWIEPVPLVCPTVGCGTTPGLLEMADNVTA
jgi:hypothetical protein